jgi:hypothetical protein
MKIRYWCENKTEIEYISKLVNKGVVVSPNVNKCYIFGDAAAYCTSISIDHSECTKYPHDCLNTYKTINAKKLMREDKLKNILYGNY